MCSLQRISVLLVLGTLFASGVQGQNVTEFPVSDLYPQEITSGPDGNLWFIQSPGWGPGGGNIGRITTAGVITEFSTRIQQPGGGPSGIAAGPDANLWFTQGRIIGRINPNGDVTHFFLPANSGAGPGIVAGPDGNLWFTGGSPAGSMIGRITPTGVVTTFALPTPDRGLYEIAAGPDGNLWFTSGYNDWERVAGNGTIGQITPTGVITLFTIPTDYSGPANIAAGPDGNLWFTEPWSNRIGRITTTGVITEFTLPGDPSVSGPFAITAGPDGAVWFTHFDGVDSKIGRISPVGVVTEFLIPTARAGLSGIASGPDGNIWFTEADGKKIGRLTLGGASGGCVPDSTTLCLTGARFQARLNWATSEGRSGAGQAVPLTGSAGYFWFHSSDNVEVVAKIVDGCALNSSYWLFVGGLTDAHVVLTVTDTATGAVGTYTSPLNVAFQPIQDTGTFRGP